MMTSRLGREGGREDGRQAGREREGCDDCVNTMLNHS